MRVLRADDLTPHALRAHLSDHDMAIVAARRARDRALVIAAMARAKGRVMATEIEIVVMGRDSVEVVASAVVVVGRVAARFAHSVSIM
jgi:hypothetical protein